jgi:flagellar biosynthetic protein FliQ
MGADDAMELMNQLLWNAMIVAAPILIGALVVGLLISVLQVTTQLQEMTLSYVPKLFTAAFLLVALGPWMIHRITQFAIFAIKTIPQLN